MKAVIGYSFTTTVNGHLTVDIPEGMSVEEWVAQNDVHKLVDDHRLTCPQLDAVSGYEFGWCDDSDESVLVESVLGDDGSFHSFKAS